MDETIVIQWNGENITMWKFIYEIMLRCKGN